MVCLSDPVLVLVTGLLVLCVSVVESACPRCACDVAGSAVGAGARANCVQRRDPWVPQRCRLVLLAVDGGSVRDGALVSGAFPVRVGYSGLQALLCRRCSWEGTGLRRDGRELGGGANAVVRPSISGWAFWSSASLPSSPSACLVHWLNALHLLLTSDVVNGGLDGRLALWFGAGMLVVSCGLLGVGKWAFWGSACKANCQGPRV